jgi:trehalose 6-phosphate phosphatase
MKSTRPLFSRAAWAAVQTATGDPRRRLLLIFDVDGTLAPIASRPAMARVPRKTLSLLALAARLPGVRVAVMSARPLRDLRRLVPVARVARIAQYGLEGPLAPSVRTRRRFRRAARIIGERLRPVKAPFPGAFIEQKGLSVAVHHRALTAHRRATLLRRLRAAEREVRALGFGTQLGDRVNDFVPIGYDKGRALRALRARVRPGATIFFGDSAGDEPAFAALAPTDVSVCVGSGWTAARYRVRGPRDVARFLSALVSERTQRPSLRRR